jgi:hypothetical protein
MHTLLQARQEQTSKRSERKDANRISVRDYIKAVTKRNQSDIGIPGYSFPTFHAHLDKLGNVNMQGQPKRKSFVDDYVRQKKIVPSPNSYTVTGDLLKGSKFHSNLSKSPRTTIIEKMMKMGGSNMLES